MYRELMAAWKRWSLRAALFLAVSPVFLYLSLFLIVKSARFQSWLQSEITRRSGYEFNAADLAILPPLRLSASAATISKGSKPVLHSEKIAVTLSPVGLLTGSVYSLELIKPTLNLDVQELFGSSSINPVKIAIRHLSVQNGAILLMTGEGKTVEFRSINVDAENINVGRTAGFHISTDLPWLEGRAEISVSGENDEKTLGLRIRQAETKQSGILSTAKELEVLIAQVKVRKTENAGFEIRSTGELNQLKLANSKWIGLLTLEGGIDSAFKQLAFSAKMTAPSLPANIGSLSPDFTKGPLTASLAGNFLLSEKKTELTSVRLETSLWKADGTGHMDFAHQPVPLNARFLIRDISPEALKPLAAEWLGAWTYSGTVEADLEIQGPWNSPAAHGVARSDGTQLVSANFSLAQFSLRAPFQWAGGSFQVKDLELAGKTLAINRKDQSKISAEKVLVKADFSKTISEPVRSSGNIEIRRGRFTNSEGSKAGENLAINGTFTAAPQRDAHLVSVTGKLKIDQGEVLWGKFYGDLTNGKPGLDFDADYAPDSVQLRRLNFSLNGIGSIDISGKIEGLTKTPVLNILAQSSAIDVAQFFEFFLRESLKTSYPVIEKLAAVGQVGFAALAQGSVDDLSVTGNLQLRTAELRTKTEKWQAGPIHLSLPFRVHLPAAKPVTTTTDIGVGVLTIASARFGSETLSPVKTRVSLRNNTLKFEQPIRIPIYGGTIEINSLVWKDFIANPRQFSLSLDAQSLQLQRLTESLEGYRLVGIISGAIPKIETVGDTLRSSGEIQIQVFGGQIQLSKMEMDSPFAGVRSIKLDSRFQDLDLEQASKTFEFGRISGILEGSVSNLVIANGQPAEFVAEAHSVEKSGVSQWISVDALNKLTVLSSGNSVGALYGGLAGFFDNFRYSKLGFKATLKNDKLTLRGIESRDGKEYLVVGSRIPPTVNVISHTQEIGFGELVRRLDQIRKSDKPQIQ